MDFLILHLLLNSGIFSVSLIFYIYRKINNKRLCFIRRNKRNIVKYLLTLLLLLSGILFVIYYKNYAINREIPSIRLIFMVVSITLFFFSWGVAYLTPAHNQRHILSMEYPSRSESKKGEIPIGRVLDENKSRHKFFLLMKDLERHMLIIGKTGSGKSNFLQMFLINLYKKHNFPFLLTEFKGEYQYLQEQINELLILKPGINFSLNIFDPEGSHSQIHAERVFQIFKSGGLFQDIEYSPQMERVFIAIINKVCANPEYRNWASFIEICEKKLIQGINIKNSLDYSIDAILNRVRRYSIGPLKQVFLSQSPRIKVRDLFNRKILLDLSSIIHLGGEKEDALFFLNVFFKHLWDYNIRHGSKNYQGIRHITIVEDAQYFAPLNFSEKLNLSSYLEDIALLLRGTGECLITLATRPDVSKEILANAGVRVCFNLDIQHELMRELLNLKEGTEFLLSELSVGNCIIKVNSIEKPFLLKVPYIERKWLRDVEIERNNELIAKKYFKTSLKYRPKTEKYCIFCGEVLDENNEYCVNCQTKLNFENKETKQLKKVLKTIVKTKKFQKNY